MNASGARITGYPPEIDISLIIYSTPIIKKYWLAPLLNYSIKLRGKKVSTLYFEVEISLFGDV